MSKVRTVIEGAKIIGKAGAKALAKTAIVVAAHPAASLRVGGVLTTASGVKDLVAYSKTRSTSTLLKGVAKVAIGAGLTIFNDKSSWYEKFQDVTPAVNAGRPMDPIYVGPFSDDPTLGSVAKMADVHISWTGYSEALAFNTAMNQYLRYTRDILRSNLPYGVEHISQFIVDSIFLTTAIAIKQRQLTFYRYNPSDFPDFYKIWNKVSSDHTTVGLHTLTELEYVSDQGIAETIARYNATVDAISGQLALPYTVSQFINYYFSNLYVADEDGCNAQYVRLVPHTMGYYLDHEALQFTDVSNLSIEQITGFVSVYNTKYGVVASDLLKAGLVTTVGFLHFEDLEQVVVHDQAILQAIINGYTDNPNEGTDNSYIRLDFLPTESDDLTTFLMLGIFNNQKDPLWTPTLRVDSMEFKFLSNASLRWDNDLFQYASTSAIPAETTKDDFSLVVRSDMTSLHETRVDVAGSSEHSVSLPGSTTQALSNVTVSGMTTVSTATQYVSAKIKATLGTDPATEAAFDDCMSAVASGDSKTIVDTMNKYVWDLYIPVAQNGPNGTTWLYQKTMGNGFKASGWTSNSLYFATAGAVQVRADGKFYVSNFADSQGNPVAYFILRSSESSESIIDVQGLLQAAGINGLTSVPKIEVTKGQVLAAEYSLTAYPIRGNPNTRYVVSPVKATLSEGSYLPIKTTFSKIASQVMSGTGEVSVDTTISSETYIPNLAGFIADAFDFHIPMVSSVRNRIILNGETKSDTIVGKSMLKEAYVPVFYNVKDLDSILYQMYYSLFMPGVGNYSGSESSQRGKKNYHKPDKKKSDGKDKSSGNT